MLQWTLACMYAFRSCFSPCIFLGLDCMVVGSSTFSCFFSFNPWPWILILYLAIFYTFTLFLERIFNSSKKTAVPHWKTSGSFFSWEPHLNKGGEDLFQALISHHISHTCYKSNPFREYFIPFEFSEVTWEKVRHISKPNMTVLLLLFIIVLGYPLHFFFFLVIRNFVLKGLKTSLFITMSCWRALTEFMEYINIDII